MRIDIITVLPELLKSPFEASILKRAIEANLVEVHFHNLRDFTTDNYKTIDDYQFGGGAGMVMMVEPIDKCISKLKSERQYDEIIYMSPDGEILNQGIANQLSLKENIIILCGHYKGVDERIRERKFQYEAAEANDDGRCRQGRSVAGNSLTYPQWQPGRPLQRRDPAQGARSGDGTGVSAGPAGPPAKRVRYQSDRLCR